MTMEEFMTQVIREFPDAEVGSDNDGQLIIFTNMTVDEEMINVIPMGEN